MTKLVLSPEGSVRLAYDDSVHLEADHHLVSDDEWRKVSHYDANHIYLVDGRLVVDPTHMAARDQAFLARRARKDLEASDLIALRCWKQGIPYPPEWQAWDEALRNVIRGISSEYPTKPERYPGLI